MEEQKNSKEAKMEVVQDNNEQKQPTYEELMEACQELSKQNRTLRQQLQQAVENLRMINRLDYLLKIIATFNGNHGFSDDFMNKCYDEVGEILFPTKEEKED